MGDVAHICTADRPRNTGCDGGSADAVIKLVQITSLAAQAPLRSWPTLYLYLPWEDLRKYTI